MNLPVPWIVGSFFIRDDKTVVGMGAFLYPYFVDTEKSNRPVMWRWEILEGATRVSWKANQVNEYIPYFITERNRN